MQRQGMNIEPNGHLSFGGADLPALAAEYKTPLYVFSEDVFRSACRAFNRSIMQFYGGHGLVLYASKAFACKAIYKVIAEEGLGADVVSGGEIYTGLQAGFLPEKLYFHGNNKSAEEIDFAVKSGVGCIVIDDEAEIAMISAAAAKYHTRQRVFLRVKPGIDAHTHNFIKTGQVDSKFGFLKGSELTAAVKVVLNAENLIYAGLHCHIGSQIFDTEPFCAAAEVMVEVMARLKSELGCETECLDLGGGFGIRYTKEDDPLAYEAFMEMVSTRLKAACNRLKVALPFVLIEPGRSIVGPAGLTLYTVGHIKNIPNIRTYVAVDGGMTDNPRYALYGAKYEVEIANKANRPKDFCATIAGKCCESGDLIGEGIAMQRPQRGDILAVLSTGAYNYSMASNYNRIPRPAAVLVKDGKARVIVARESYEDLIKNDLD